MTVVVGRGRSAAPNGLLPCPTATGRVEDSLAIQPSDPTCNVGASDSAATSAWPRQMRTVAVPGSAKEASPLISPARSASAAWRASAPSPRGSSSSVGIEPREQLDGHLERHTPAEGRHRGHTFPA